MKEVAARKAHYEGTPGRRATTAQHAPAQRHTHTREDRKLHPLACSQEAAVASNAVASHLLDLHQPGSHSGARPRAGICDDRLVLCNAALVAT